MNLSKILSKWLSISRTAMRVRQRSRRRLALNRTECLEARVMPTTTLYVDFGDRFPGGVLNTTVGELDSTQVGFNPDIDGPPFDDGSDNDYPANTSLSLTSFNNLYGDAASAMRTTVMEVVRRTFEPFDITVVELSGAVMGVNGTQVRAASSLDDISITLGLNESEAENNDAYILVAAFLIDGTDDPSTRIGGVDPGTDVVGARNENDGTAVVCLTGNDSVLFVADTISHEAGHSFGLSHAYRQDPENLTPPFLDGLESQYDTLHRSELMSYLAVSGDSFFSRFPTMLGDGNTDRNQLASDPTPYDQLVNDPNIGPGLVEYVTGTGANDLVEISVTGPGTARVSVRAFADSAHTIPIDAPGATGFGYQYEIDTTKHLIVHLGVGVDRLIVDASLSSLVTVDGMGGADTLQVTGSGSESVTYTPRLNRSDAGMIGTSSGMALAFEGFEPVIVNEVNSLTFVTPGSRDSITVEGGVGGQNTVTGFSNFGSFESLFFFGVRDVVIDTATNDSDSANDTITFVSDLTASGLASLTVRAGAGGDMVDALKVTQVPLFISGGVGNDQLFGGGGDDFIEGGDGADVMEGGGGSDTLDGGAGADIIAVADRNTPRQETVTVNLGNDDGDADAIGVVGRNEADNYSVFSTHPGQASVLGLSMDVLINEIETIDGIGIDVLAGDDVVKVDANLTGMVLISLKGGDGNDFLSADATLLGDAGDDTLVGGAGKDSIDGGDGNDWLFGLDDDDTLNGGLGDDQIFGGTGSNSVEQQGGDGDDLIDFSENVVALNHIVVSGNDTVIGTAFDDRFSGGTGNERLDGRGGSDTLNGGTGNDTLIGGDGSDRVIVRGSDGVADDFELDALTANQTKVRLNGDTSRLDEVESVEFRGDTGADSFTIHDLSASDILSILIDLESGDNNDDIVTVEGRTVSDHVLASSIQPGALRVSGLSAEVLVDGVAANDLLKIRGLDGDDDIKVADDLTGAVRIQLEGGSGNDLLYADATLLGDAGNDTLVSGIGNDTINGGDGTDRVVATGNVNFTLTNTTLTGLGTDTLTSIEQASLTGGDGANTFNIGAFSGSVTLNGAGGADTVDFSESTTRSVER